MDRQPFPGGQIDEANRPAASERPAQRLPFRRVDGQRIEARVCRIVPAVQENRDRRPHRGRGGEPQHLIGIGRTFDQHHRRIEPVERRPQALGRARPVMADAEDAQPFRRGHLT
jgi:hypothetical protein